MAAFVLGAATLIFVYNVIISWWRGEPRAWTTRGAR